MDPVGLTEQMAKTLAFIQGFIDAKGWSPSYQEIMDALEWKSKATAARTVNMLIDRGYLAKRSGANRSLVVLKRVPGSAAAIAAANAAVYVPLPSNLPRYEMLDDLLLRNYVIVSGEHPEPQEDKTLRWLAVAMTALPDDHAVAYRLRRISGALANAATEIEKKAKSAA